MNVTIDAPRDCKGTLTRFYDPENGAHLLIACEECGMKDRLLIGDEALADGLLQRVEVRCQRRRTLPSP